MIWRKRRMARVRRLRMNSIERGIETAIFSMRWLLAPFFLGLFIAILAVLYKFIIQLYQLLMQLADTSTNQTVVGVLKLVDFALIANLLLIAVFAAHANLIHKIRPEERPDWPDDLTRHDIGGLRQKLLGSIVAIATIETLEWY